MKQLMKPKRLIAILLVLSLLVSFSSCLAQQPPQTTAHTQVLKETAEEVLGEEKGHSYSQTEEATEPEPSQEKTEPIPAVGNAKYTKVNPSNLPPYTGNAFVAVNDNIPNFSSEELTTTAYEAYSSLDALGRCGTAIASCGREIMPKDGESRGSISNVYPSGWEQAKYEGVSGGYLWNRCHLLGWQLSAENANRRNLITGTRYMNTQGMLPFENMVADYIRETGNHVAYRVTPIFQGDFLVCSGVEMEAYSIEDRGEGISFHVYCYNVQPGIIINYATGESSAESKPTPPPTTTTANPTTTTASAPGSSLMVWIPNSGSKYHSSSSCSNMKNPTEVTREEAIRRGFEPCKKCY